MSTPTQPETLTLERTLEGLQLVINLKEMWDRIPEEDQELIRLLKSAIHHLEAGHRALTELANGEMECGHCTRGGETYDEFAKRHIMP